MKVANNFPDTGSWVYLLSRSGPAALLTEWWRVSDYSTLIDGEECGLTPLYVGRSENLKTRIRAHYAEKKSWFAGEVKVEAWAVGGTLVERDGAEKWLIDYLDPVHQPPTDFKKFKSVQENSGDFYDNDPGFSATIITPRLLPTETYVQEELYAAIATLALRCNTDEDFNKELEILSRAFHPDEVNQQMCFLTDMGLSDTEFDAQLATLRAERRQIRALRQEIADHRPVRLPRFKTAGTWRAAKRLEMLEEFRESLDPGCPGTSIGQGSL